MTPIEIIAAAHVAATLLVGAVHAVLILLGLRVMRRASDSRDKALAAQAQAADQRHDEAMQALETLIARTALSGPQGGARQAGATMARVGAGLRLTMRPGYPRIFQSPFSSRQAVP